MQLADNPGVHLGEWLHGGAPIGVSKPVKACGIFPAVPPKQLDAESFETILEG